MKTMFGVLYLRSVLFGVLYLQFSPHIHNKNPFGSLILAELESNL
jgi:hypothetical protein